MNGSDHLGYAQLSDWIRSHFHNQHPISSPAYPYQSWPEFQFHSDTNPRFGSYFILSFIGTLRHLPGMFSYDAACATFLSAGFLSIASIFARSPFTYFLLLMGLLTCQWFDYSHSGFLGKILGYPSTLMIIGLFLFSPRPWTPKSIGMLILLTFSTSIMHSGISTGVYIFFLLGSYLFIQLFFKSVLQLKEEAIVFSMILLISIATTGVLIKPIDFGFATLDTATWLDLIPRMIDLETTYGGPHFTAFTINELLYLFFINVSIIFIFFITAIKLKNQAALSIFLGTLMLFITLVSLNLKWEASQISGTFYPWILCASAHLIDSVSLKKGLNKKHYYGAVVLFLLLLATHYTRIHFAIQRYSGNHIDPMYQFSQDELNKISRIVKENPLRVDIDTSMLAIPLLVELGRQNIKLEWTPETWSKILAYRKWNPPSLTEKKYYLIKVKTTMNKNTNCILEYETHQYHLYKCK